MAAAYYGGPPAIDTLTVATWRLINAQGTVALTTFFSRDGGRFVDLDGILPLAPSAVPGGAALPLPQPALLLLPLQLSRPSGR